MVFGRGSHREHFVAIEARPGFVGTQHVDERERVRGGRHVVGVDARDLLRVLEDHPELTGELLDLVLGERETSQLRNVLDVGARELRHGGESRDRYDAAVPAYPFLSDEWLAEVRRIVDAQDMEVPSGTNLTMNLLVTETPFPEDRRLNIAMQGGNADWSAGHVDGADLTLTTDYVTAREVLMSGDAQAALQAFMEGKVKIQGDLTKLMAAQASGAAPGGIALAGAIADITE